MTVSKHGWLALACLLSACAVGPDYRRPEISLGDGYKAVQMAEQTTQPDAKAAQANEWKIATPAAIEPGSWWEIFGDAKLNRLQQQLLDANQTVVAAEARYRQARAAAQGARAAYFPNLSLDTSSLRSGGNQLSNTSTSKNLALDASWELDVWGRIRRQVEAGEASAQASKADLAAALLSAQAELAQNYFLLRIADAQQALLDRTVGDYQKSLQLTRNRYAVGVVSRAEVAQAETQLKAAQAQATDNQIDRTQLENAIAILLGKPPVEVALAPVELEIALPQIPLTLPSTLLERRPDIAAAERRVVAANAQVGVARAAYFPVLGVSATGGYRSDSFSDWLTVPNRFWSIGPTLSLPLFDAGLRKSQSAQAIAAYDEAVANYRQTVLVGLQEVENNLVAIDRLAQEVAYQQDAVRAAREALQLVTNQYKAGTVGYLNVIVTATAAYNNERNLLQARGRQLTASVLLIKALGGNWDSAQLQAADR